MTIATTTRKAGPFVGNGVATTFDFAFKVFARSDITVTLVVIATGVESVLVLDTHYTVALNADQNANPGGTVTYNPSGTPMASTRKLTIDSAVAETQGLDIENAGGFNADTLEAALDRCTILAQQKRISLDRTIKQPTSDANAIGELPTASVRASRPLWFDAAGDPTVVAGTDADAVVSSAMESFVASASLAAARSTLSTYSQAQVDAFVAALLPLAGGTMTGPINDKKSTVASHATTGDIWSVGSVIDWTGTQTTTAFPNAPQAGARRLLVCAGACKFTAGSNLLVEGVASGVTVTMKADALVEVVAITTTKFKLTYSLSGSFTATGTGFTASVTATWNYTVTNGEVTVSIATLSGTSNTTAFTVTGFPAEIQPSTPRSFMPLVVVDNNAYLYTGFGNLDTGTLTLYTTAGGAGWTAASTKNIYPTTTLKYRL